MYEIPIYRVALVKESSFSSRSERSVSPSSLAQILEKVFEGLDREHFKVVMLDGKNKIIGINTVSIGSLTQAIVAPPQVFKPAILCNAAAIVLTHNHPSGDPQPSFEDRRVTTHLKEVGELLMIKVVDHIIIGGEGSYFSIEEDRIKHKQQEEEKRHGEYIRKAIERRGKGKATLSDLLEVTKFVILRFHSGRDDCEKEILDDLTKELKLFLGKKRVSISLRDEVEKCLDTAEYLLKVGNNAKAA
jgi:DNA repair protein RadC